MDGHPFFERGAFLLRLDDAIKGTSKVSLKARLGIDRVLANAPGAYTLLLEKGLCVLAFKHGQG